LLRRSADKTTITQILSFYCLFRVNSEGQREKHSLPAQRRMIEAFAAMLPSDLIS